MSGPTLRPAEPGNGLPSTSWSWLVFATCLSLQGEGLRGRTHTSPHPSPSLIGLHHGLWPGSFLSPLDCYITEPLPFCTAQEIHVCMDGRELAILSNFSPLGLPQNSSGHRHQDLTVSTPDKPSSKALASCKLFALPRNNSALSSSCASSPKLFLKFPLTKSSLLKPS